MLRENESPIDRAGVLAEQLAALSQILVHFTQGEEVDVVTMVHVIREKAVELEQMISKATLDDMAK
jgi:hypothetical protein